MLHVSLRVLLVALSITLGGAFQSVSYGQERSQRAGGIKRHRQRQHLRIRPPRRLQYHYLLTQRIAALEAYINNVDAGAGLSEEQKKTFVYACRPWPQRLVDGCAALVLFMTLPGLALFYGVWCVRKTCFRSWLNASAVLAWSQSCGHFWLHVGVR